MWRSAWLTLALGVGVATAAYAGDSYNGLTGYSWVSWTTSEGLFPGPFRAIAQDKDGYLWLGVSGDLIRFDGVRFVDAETLSPGTLSSKGVVTVLCAARDGSLWIGRSINGVSRMLDGRVTNYGLEDGVPDGAVTAIVEDARGAIWVGSRSGLGRFLNNRWEWVGSPDAWPGDPVDSLFEDRSGNLWVDNSVGTFVRRAGVDRFESVPVTSDSIQSFAEDRSGALWVTDRVNGFKKLDLGASTGLASHTSRRANGVRLLADRAGNLWVATRGQGLLRVRPGDRQVEVSIQQLGKTGGLASDIVLSLFEDREGNIWVGTENSLVRVSQSHGISADRTGLSSAHEITATSDGSVWIGTTEGLHRFSATSRQQYTEADGLPSNTITALAYNRGGPLWVATDRGLARFVNGRFRPARLPGDLRVDNVRSLTTDNDGALWFCDPDQGLFRWRAEGKLDAFSDRFDFSSKRCPSAYTDRDGHVWIGFADGTLAMYRDGTFDRYSERDGLTGGIVTSLYQDEGGTMWIGTNKGLSRLQHGRFTSFTLGNGLPAKAVAGILGDGLGSLWLSMISGIIRIERTEFDRAAADKAYRIRYASYDGSDGLNGAPLYLGFPNATRGTDGRLWFVTTGGLVIVDPQQLRENDLPPPPRIESVTANGQVVMDPKAGLRLPPNI